MTTRTIPLVLAEIESARAKHGDSIEKAGGNHDKRYRILMSEIGEVAEAIDDLEAAVEAAGRDYAGGNFGDGDLGIADRVRLHNASRHLKAELVQVAATAMRWIAVLDAEEGK